MMAAISKVMLTIASLTYDRKGKRLQSNNSGSDETCCCHHWYCQQHGKQSEEAPAAILTINNRSISAPQGVNVYRPWLHRTT
jgi:hypothetical protein